VQTRAVLLAARHDQAARPAEAMRRAGRALHARIGRRERVYPCTVENSDELARFAAHHRPFYEQLYAQRLDVTPWERDQRS
jgi:hypothetical protein